MSYLSYDEALRVSDAFLMTMYGTDVYTKWKQVKVRMSFTSERNFVTWILALLSRWLPELLDDVEGLPPEDLVRVIGGSGGAELMTPSECGGGVVTVVDSIERPGEPQELPDVQTAHVAAGGSMVHPAGGGAVVPVVAGPAPGPLATHTHTHTSLHPLPHSQPTACTAASVPPTISMQETINQHQVSEEFCHSDVALPVSVPSDNIREHTYEEVCIESSSQLQHQPLVGDLSSAKTVRRGGKKHQRVEYTCACCPDNVRLTFTNFGEYKRHCAEAHGGGGGGVMHECDRCDYRTTLRGNFTKHLLTHDMSGGDGYQCEQCLRTFRNVSNLKRHVAVLHGGGGTGGGRLVCTTCGYSGARQTTDMRKHMVRRHGHHTEHQCPAPHCGKYLWSRSLLNSHMETHLSAAHRQRLATTPSTAATQAAASAACHTYLSTLPTQ